MTDKELRHLSRMELIRLLLEQTKELERVQQELTQAKKAMEERRIQIHNAGSIAEAALQINRVMEAAQGAADQYVENIKQEYRERAKTQCSKLQIRIQEMEKTAKARCDAMLQEAQRKAENDGADG